MDAAYKHDIHLIGHNGKKERDTGPAAPYICSDSALPTEGIERQSQEAEILGLLQDRHGLYLKLVLGTW